MLDFSVLPRFKVQAYSIIQMIPVWAQALQVDEQAIIRQIAWAHGWCESNKAKAPKKNMVRFLFNWMVRAKKLGNLVSVTKHDLYKEPEPEGEVMDGDDFKRMREALRK